LVEWDETLETGDRLVDLQHRHIYEILRELEAAEDTPAEEEDLMRREEYPPNAIHLHQTEHRLLTERTRDYVLQFRTGELSGTAPLIIFLGDWLHGHVEACDRDLIDHVRARGGAAKVPPEWVGKSRDSLAS
jgi:hemerythrin